MGFGYHKRITIIPKFLYLNINGKRVNFSIGRGGLNYNF
ncbi:hypothetical protein J008_06092 [Cryptococcus neoformans]|uniref:DUF4236 domain-containing protein n=1 Tax=Cryptococcus neoformans Tu259-1 TaxID=1230072 RepID=A0A854QMW2_CRYNE|nr:hypothetical protein C362_05250 [Cryptococcus neoformans var. grubii Bt1]OWZ30007.1 hypothetical protein C356_06089 [Cryptococcus neoformans var. grubii c45]OWZ33856.1 hypothetical protein C347_02059 [Cryptococcus neoformans var. grubii AD2-60a]OWZ45984.1 hypothetical protein C343_01991 [Cryptococcus neoformans var. grubii C23]OWZ49123.1 hypothetical protein C353_01893 [Cryptococcus neoformans var. grubii AD1-83a]OWZ56187.1 hypothetical protein C368_01811 [Cryptococcus neoformans var. grubi